jgi:hypothetical protein
VFLRGSGRAPAVLQAAEFAVHVFSWHSLLESTHDLLFQVRHHIIQQIEEFIRDVVVQSGELVESGAVAIGFKHFYFIVADNHVLNAAPIAGERVIEQDSVSCFTNGGGGRPWVAVISIAILVVTTLTDWCGESEFRDCEGAGGAQLGSAGGTRRRNLDGKSWQSGIAYAFTRQKIQGKVALSGGHCGRINLIRHLFCAQNTRALWAFVLVIL